MRKIIGISFCLFFSLFFVSSSIQAQYNNVEVGAYVGASSYYGDLNPLFSFRHIGPSMGVFARRNLDGRVCLRLNAAFAHVWADDAKSPGAFTQARNLRFRSNVFDGSFILEFNFQDFHGGSRDDVPVAPYILTGFGLTYFNPKAEFEGGMYPLRNLGTEGQPRGQEYGLISPVILAGGGLKFDINRQWSCNIEFAYRYTFTDYLDDVSGVYADYRTVAGHHGDAAAALSDRSLEVGSVRIGAPGHQRGDATNKDAYIHATVGLAYRFMPLTCPAY